MLPPLLLPVHDKCQELLALIDYLRRSEQDAGNYNIHEAENYYWQVSTRIVAGY